MIEMLKIRESQAENENTCPVWHGGFCINALGLRETETLRSELIEMFGGVV